MKSTYETLNWKISDADFLDKDTLSYEDLYHIFANCNTPEFKADPERFAKAVYNISQNFNHKDFQYSGRWLRKLQDDARALIPEGAKGINPEIILTTLQGESGFGKTSDLYFGVLGSGDNGFEEQLEESVSLYINFYYFGMFAKQEHPNLYSANIVENGILIDSYVPANAAMFSRGTYNTESLYKMGIWQDLYLAKNFK